VVTKALAVKALLKEWAEAQDIKARDGVQVTYGYPTREPERRWIGLGDVQWESSEWVTNRSREEVFSVTIIFDVLMAAGTAEEAEQYALAMSAEFEATVKANPNLDGLAVTSGYQPTRLKSWTQATGYEAQYETEVTATCRT
jgi:hypothetical protein